MNMTVSSAGPRERSRAATVPPLFRQAADEFTGRLLRHPFLARCSEGRATMDELRSYLVQQGKYSRYFTRYLCALMSSLEDGGDVLHLAENLAEELGFCEDDGTPHSRLYTQMLANFGIDLDKQPIQPETQNLIDTMFMLCRQPGDKRIGRPVPRCRSNSPADLCMHHRWVPRVRRRHRQAGVLHHSCRLR